MWKSRWTVKLWDWVNMYFQMLYPSIFYTHLIHRLKPISAVTGREAGFTLNRSLSPSLGHRDKPDKQPFTLTFPPRVNLEAAISLTCMSLGGRRSWSTLREHRHKWREHANSTQKVHSWDSNQELYCCEVTTLPTTSLFRRHIPAEKNIIATLNNGIPRCHFRLLPPFCI